MSGGETGFDRVVLQAACVTPTVAICCRLDALRRLIGPHRIHEVPTEIALDEIDAATAA